MPDERLDPPWVEECAKDPGRRWRLRAERTRGALEVSNDGRLDELVVDHWFHLEYLDERTWNVRIGDVRLQATVQSSGDVVVNVQRGFYLEARGSTSTWEPEGSLE